MTDALAADNLLGGTPTEMFAFGSHAKGREEQARSEWKAKNVTPILYRKTKRHWYLHRTLWAWASTYRDGIDGKESIIVRHAGLQPLASTEQDNFVGRVLWALSDSSGQPPSASPTSTLYRPWTGSTSSQTTVIAIAISTGSVFLPLRPKTGSWRSAWFIDPLPIPLRRGWNY